MNRVINLFKPAGITSHQALTRVKRLLGVKKAGHAGTLDPIATGVLIICLNESTKIARFLSDLDKEYIVRFKLGERTDTFDSTGKIIETKDPDFIQENDILDVFHRFIGSIPQTPPMYSAVKIGGQRLYKLARQGVTVDRAERIVFLHRIELLSYDNPYVDARVACSKGTYIRTLCDDIGRSLGTGAHMTALERIRVGNFTLKDAVSLGELADRKGSFYSVDEALSHLREITLDHDSWQKLCKGGKIHIRGDFPENFGMGLHRVAKNKSSVTSEYIRMKTPDHILFGVGVIENNCLSTERLFHVPGHTENRP